MGKTVGEWADEMGKHGMGQGGFVGQQTKATGIPIRSSAKTTTNINIAITVISK